MRQLPPAPLPQALAYAILAVEAQADNYRPPRGGYSWQQAEALAAAKTLKALRTMLDPAPAPSPGRVAHNGSK